MRLWSLHPSYLDTKGLLALWREALLAQEVLLGNTKGYQHHPQLIRFREHEKPLCAIGTYLFHVQKEAAARQYRFDVSKIKESDESVSLIVVTDGQMAFELQHLKNKLRQRDPDRFATTEPLLTAEPHPIFRMTSGTIADWERV